MGEQGLFIVGLTGQTGAGKTTISKFFSGRGATVLNADLIAKETMEGSIDCLADLVLEYSTEIITPDATLNRKKLAAICFSDKQKLNRLNEITYPHIIYAIRDRINQAIAYGERMLVLDAPTLYEAGLHKECDKVLAVLADEETRVRRIMERDRMTEEEARLRVKAQKKDSFYTERADYILKNDDDVEGLRLSFLDLFAQLERDAGYGEPLKEDRKDDQPLEEAPSEDQEQRTQASEDSYMFEELESQEV